MTEFEGKSLSRKDVDPARRATMVVIALFLIMTLAMVVCFRFPPLLDFANHYARAWLIAGGIHEPPFNDIYTLDWSRTSTNIGMDVAALVLGPLIGVDLLMRGLLWLAIILPPLGAMALHRQIYGSSSPWMLASLYFAWCATMIGGFLNFQIGLGFALLFAALDHRMSGQNPVVVFIVRAAVSLFLIYEHIFALGFYMVLLGGLAIGPDYSAFRSSPAFGRMLGRILLIALACGLPLALVVATAHSLPGAHAGAGFGSIRPNLDVLDMIGALASAFWTYWLTLDFGLVLVLPALITVALLARQMRLHAGLAVAWFLLLALSLFSPVHALGTGWISWRFPIMAALVWVVMLRPFSQTGRAKACALVLIMAALTLGRTAWIGYNWWRAEADSRQLQAVIADIPAGASVLPVIHLAAAGAQKDEVRHRYAAWYKDTFRHLPTLAVPLAHAAVPSLFTAAGKQPLAVKQEWLDRTVPETNLLSIHALQCQRLRQWELTPYLDRWREKYDYVLVVNADLPDQYVGDGVPPGLIPVVDTGFARLYRIDKAFGESDGPFACAANVPQT